MSRLLSYPQRRCRWIYFSSSSHPQLWRSSVHSGEGGSRWSPLADRAGGWPAIQLLSHAKLSSDRLLGYSPMAPSSPTFTAGKIESNTIARSTDDTTSTTSTGQTGSLPPASVTTTTSTVGGGGGGGGGVWAPTSAKREALAELRAAATSSTNPNLRQMSGDVLDQEATTEEKMDLYLLDGLRLITNRTDQGVPALATEKIGEPGKEKQYRMITSWQQQLDNLLAGKETLSLLDYETFVKEWEKRIDAFLATIPPKVHMKDVRDIMDASAIPPLIVQEDNSTHVDPTTMSGAIIEQCTDPNLTDHFEQAVLRLRLHLVRSISRELLTQWQNLISVSDQDIDRAAVQGAPPPVFEAIPANKIRSVLLSFLTGSCHARVETIWDLMDKDNDGLLDQPEMALVCEMAIRPVGEALRALLLDALEAAPVRVLMQQHPGMEPTAALSWRQRRNEHVVKRRLAKWFQKTVNYHFRDEVELPHRLRCIYAWSEKQHQDNKVDAVLVDEWSGRKRYVELHPKIALPEFRQVQREHLPHLDRVGEEYWKSFREDLWVRQGKGRQRKELIRDCFAFLALVSLVDYVIMTM